MTAGYSVPVIDEILKNYVRQIALISEATKLTGCCYLRFLKMIMGDTGVEPVTR